jgi:hypothetical protein
MGRHRSAVLHKRSVTRAWQVAATNFATFGWLEPPISEEIPFGNGTKQCEQSGGEEEPFGGSSVFRQLENSAVANVCHHVDKYSDESQDYPSIVRKKGGIRISIARRGSTTPNSPSMTIATSSRPNP